MSEAITIVRRQVPEHGPWPPGFPLVLQRVLAARGVLSAEAAELRLANLLRPDSLGQLNAAVALLAAAIADRRHIVVVGDFECDGATGTAVAVRGLRMLGASHVSFRVPNRATHGYGLSPALVDDLEAMAPELVLTVDSGIACHAGVRAAKDRGWQVLVTDHHLPGEQLPPADVIVNPNLAGDAFPSKALAGVGVMFYLLLALRRHLREQGAFAGLEPDLSCLLDLVAVGTVADMVPLDGNNRILVAAGLKRLRQGQGQPGLRALAGLAGRAEATLTAADIGFGIAPRLNAAGRLDDMALGIECLICDDTARAEAMASALDAINGERRERQQSMVDDAEAALQAMPLVLEGLPPAFILFDPSWHAGVVGLVASRIKDRCHRPALAFAPSEPDSGMLRGSARSIPGLHIRDALARVDALHPGLIERFGGHAMAAGLSLRAENLEPFRTAMLASVESMLAPELLRAELWSDGPLAPMEFTREIAESLRMAGPWGQGFAEPVFDNVFEVREWRVLGERHLKLSLSLASDGPVISAIHFGGWQGTPPSARIHAAYQVEPDDFRGRKGVQLLIRHWYHCPSQ